MSSIIKTKKFIAFISIILFSIIGAFLFLHKSEIFSDLIPVSAAGESWLSGYGYRKTVTVNSASALSNYQIKLTVPYVTSKMNTDFSDLRFTSSDGATELSYWIESYTASTPAIVWVKVPSISSGDNTIYIYYGKNSATTASNGDDTFDFFDDFNNEFINRSKWINTSYGYINTCPSLVYGSSVTCTASNIGSDVIYKFTIPGTTGSNTSETSYWAFPYGVTAVNYLVVGGGGGGGDDRGGGGGAGGVLSGTDNLPASGSAVTITVGRGGWSDANGGGSTFNDVSVTGGGGGGYFGVDGNNGGSGGGSGTGWGTSSYVHYGGTGIAGQGYAGGNSYYGILARRNTGGGGGAGGAGIGLSSRPDGGAGITSSITGSSVTYAGGGGGGDQESSYSYYGAGLGGSSVGGAGGGHLTTNKNGGNGVVNTGSGGGGAGNDGSSAGAPGNGSSGIVITKFTQPLLTWRGSMALLSGELKSTTTLDKLASVGTFNSGVVLETKSRYASLPTNGYQVAGFYLSSSNGIGYLNHPSGEWYRNDANWVSMAAPPPASTNLRTKISVKSDSAVDISVTNYDTGASYQSVSDINNTVLNEPIVLGSRYDDLYGGLYESGQSYEAYWDWVFVRKYSSVEPTSSLGTEENYVSATSSGSALSCFITSGTCSGTTVFNMENYLGGHAELYSGSNYRYKVCCTGISSNSCSSNYAVVLRLSDTANAHVEQNDKSNSAYDSNKACISKTGSISCSYASSCASLGSNYACLASISENAGSGDAGTNAHVGVCGVYTTQVCCTSGIPASSCTVGILSTPSITAAGNVQLCSDADITNSADPCYSICWKGTGSPDLTSSDWKCSTCKDSSNNVVSCYSGGNTYSWTLSGGHSSSSDYTVDSLTIPNPVFNFNVADNTRKATLSINSNLCAGTTLSILPRWREISPFQ
ncbi:MAG TPA: DUF2341 domain-containing protein [Candidatus Pacearchaeota archaeon]|nr:DUF2341 domain-containing protein [Candidatus Pacearchaeota archaeon]HPR79738.1 DUF2341 domain-containing protein [Candidatus Pacearchaeota archaeon]